MDYWLVNLLFFFMCVIVWVNTTCVGGCLQRPKRVLNLLEREFQVVMSHPTWMPGIKLKSSGRAASTLTTEPSLQHQTLAKFNRVQVTLG